MATPLIGHWRLTLSTFSSLVGLALMAGALFNTSPLAAATNDPNVDAFLAVYVEESSPGNAEDATEVLSVSYSFGKTPELDERVPEKLAKLLCAGNCVVTRNFSQLEPDTFERKYYAPGIGVFLKRTV